MLSTGISSEPETGWAVRRWGVRGFGALLLLMLAACAGGGAPSIERPPGAAPAPAPTPAPGNQFQQQLDTFARKCQKSLEYRPGQIDYPTALQLDLGQSKTYGVAIDIREAPVPPGEVIPPDSAGSAKVLVQCEVAARLVAVGDGLEIAATESIDGGWRVQRFGPSGVVEWSWSVTAASLPRSQEVRLEVRPALRSTTTVTVASSEMAVFVTPVAVQASTIQRVGYWFQTDWEVLVTVLAAFGGAVGGLWAWPPGRSALRRLRKKPANPGPPGP